MKKPVFEAYDDPRDWVTAFRVWERHAARRSIIDTFSGVTGLEPKFCAVLNADASEKGEPFPFRMPDFSRSAPFFVAVETVEGEIVTVDVAAGESFPRGSRRVDWHEGHVPIDPATLLKITHGSKQRAWALLRASVELKQARRDLRAALRTGEGVRDATEALAIAKRARNRAFCAWRREVKAAAEAA